MRSGTGRVARAAGMAGDRVCAGLAAVVAAADARPRIASTRFRTRQPGQRVPPQRDRARLPGGRRQERVGRRTPPRSNKRAHERADPRCRAGLLESRQLDQGHSESGKTLTPRLTDDCRLMTDDYVVVSRQSPVVSLRISRRRSPAPRLVDRAYNPAVNGSKGTAGASPRADGFSA